MVFNATFNNISVILLQYYKYSNLKPYHVNLK